ncbi:hypothetical protein A3194_00395 [Candidatus Thiodiazotropha endoloripes]|uniref:hypothetical protein n=1 Tax=Candidatus Thiodiazotropha endoloripes TaxID=1818881 RepID=UPI00083D9616|nr:hypothetical protein [Candidatus Thiodiazotropha endoloripes]ODB93198.1 hypothetical protein A3194_00395 [Candidatus Thiodiazotropha endoloripes]
MSYWSNIEVPPKDPEIIEIDNFERNLGEYSEDIKNVRELIRRFEVCHFKSKVHLKYLVDSIHLLYPNIVPIFIGENHISKGEGRLKRDTTGRSVLGQQYVCSLKNWLGDHSQQDSEFFSTDLNQKIEKWLNSEDLEKERLVSLLVSRLMWDWESYKKYQNNENPNELETQVYRMDICHYAFPKHLDLLLEGIGQNRPIEDFEGCGSINLETKGFIEEQFIGLCDKLRSYINKGNLDKRERLKVWLIASLAKTLKEQVGIKVALPRLK